MLDLEKRKKKKKVMKIYEDFSVILVENEASIQLLDYPLHLQVYSE